MPGSIDGIAIAEMSIGGILLWSGLKGDTLSDAVKQILAGKAPSTDSQLIGSPVVSVNGSGSSGGTIGSGPGAVASNPSGSLSFGPMPGGVVSGTATANKALARLLMANRWPDSANFNSLVALWTRESGWNEHIINPGSGAFGIAQALGHGDGASKGVCPTVTIPGGGLYGTNVSIDQYGGFGLSDAQAKQANSGSAYWQIAWGLSYINATYGSPNAAEQHEQSAGWY